MLYFEMMFNNVGNKEKIRRDLLEYCKLDTEGMVKIVSKLKELTSVRVVSSR